MTLHSPVPAEAAPDGPITSVAIREFDPGSATPIRTIRVPVKVFTLASALVPRRVRDELAKEGFDLEGILQAAREIRSPVTLVEVEEHQKGRKIVVSLE
jgi:hypothetical protein